MKLYKVVIVAGLSILAVLMAANLAVGNEKEQQQPQAPQVPQAPKTQKAEEDPNAAPLFALVASDGKDYKLSDFKGKIVVLEWFNYDCPFVRAMHQAGIPAKLMQKYNPNKVVWLAINSTYYADAEADKKFISEYDLKYPILRDPDGRVGKLYKARTTPHMFVIDGRGIIVYQGAMDNAPRAQKPEKDAYINYVEQAVDELLAGKAVSIKQTKPYGCSVKYPPDKK